MKLLSEGKLKFMLNSEGKLEEEQETHAERHARTIALIQVIKASNAVSYLDVLFHTMNYFII